MFSSNGRASARPTSWRRLSSHCRDYDCIPITTRPLRHHASRPYAPPLGAHAPHGPPRAPVTARSAASRRDCTSRLYRHRASPPCARPPFTRPPSNPPTRAPTCALRSPIHACVQTCASIAEGRHARAEDLTLAACVCRCASRLPRGPAVRCGVLAFVGRCGDIRGRGHDAGVGARIRNDTQKVRGPAYEWPLAFSFLLCA